MNNCEVLARNLLDVGFKYTWTVENYLKGIDEDEDTDSPTFEVYVNGVQTKWYLALRYWTDESGKKLCNPVVICLNLVSATGASLIGLDEEIEVRYQFGILNSLAKQYEVCPVSCKAIDLNKCSSTLESEKIVSIGTREMFILDRHVSGKNIEIFCKIMLVRQNAEQNCLSVDLWTKLRTGEYCDVTIKSSDNDLFPAHKAILACRSPVLPKMIDEYGVINLDISTPLLTSLLQYIYTDRVDPMDSPQCLLKSAVHFELNGLKNLCEKNLIDSITPINVASLLLVADTFGCESLKKAALGFCEENSRSIIKTVAWKVMEQVNPELFQEVCQQL